MQQFTGTNHGLVQLFRSQHHIRARFPVEAEIPIPIRLGVHHRQCGVDGLIPAKSPGIDSRLHQRRFQLIAKAVPAYLAEKAHLVSHLG